MAQPAVPPNTGSLELSVQEVRSRLIPLARLADLTGRVTIITESGRQIAALVPADAARSRDEARADALAVRDRDEAHAGDPAVPGRHEAGADGPAVRGRDEGGADGPAVRGRHEGRADGRVGGGGQVAPGRGRERADGTGTTRGDWARAGSGLESPRRDDAPYSADQHRGRTPDAGWHGEAGGTDRRGHDSGSDADGRRAAAARGWEQRIDAVREQVRAQHRLRIRELEQALARAWELIDGVRPPGVDRAADLLRAEHRDLLAEVDAAGRARANSSAAAIPSGGETAYSKGIRR